MTNTLIKNLDVNTRVMGAFEIMVWDKNSDMGASRLGFNSGSFNTRLYRRQLTSVHLNFFTCKTEELDKKLFKISSYAKILACVFKNKHTIYGID